MKQIRLDSKILYNHLICHKCDSFTVEIVDCIYKADRKMGPSKNCLLKGKEMDLETGYCNPPRDLL